MKIALYSRVSTKDKGQDVANQIIQLEEYCQRQGWTIVSRFSDTMSGKTDARPGLQAMFQAASRKEFDLVLFWSMDRFTREGALQTLQHLQRLTSCGVNYKSFTELYIDSCGVFAEAVISIIATLAKQERLRISERTIAGLERTRKAGTVLGRPRIELDKQKVYEMLALSMKPDKIASHLGVSESTIYRLMRQS